MPAFLRDEGGFSMTETSEVREDLLSRVVVRHLHEEDLPALEWEGEYTHFRRMYADAYQRMKRGLTLMWVAELQGVGIIGQVFVQFLCDRPELCNGVDRAYLYAFRVRAPYRSRGVGALILSIVEEDLRRRGFRYVTLNVARDNPRAQAFYERHGYHVVAPEPGRWQYINHLGRLVEVVEPAWRMEKSLVP